MVLELEEIADILQNNPQADRIAKAVEQYELLFMHCTGVGIDEYVKEMREFMREGNRDTLIDMMRGNRDVIARVMRPRDKIYFAKGGMEQFNLPENQEQQFREYLSNIADGLSYVDWIRQRLQMNYDYNPNGVVHIEINEYNLPYPRIRCITDIYDYLPNGRALEYVVYNVSDHERMVFIASGLLPAGTQPKDKVYRVVDDAADRIIILTETNQERINAGKLRFVEGMEVTSEIPNEFGYVPAMIISDIPGYGDCFDSPLSEGVELLNALMTDQGLFSWTYWRQAFPKEWMQPLTCPTCQGHGDNEGQPCKECKGTGFVPFLRNSDVVQINYKGEGGDRIPTPPMGVVAPEVEAMMFMQQNCMSIEGYFKYTMWGTEPANPFSKGGPVGGASKGGDIEKTAYETQQNKQPEHDRLKIFGSWKTSIIKFLADTCGWYMYRNTYDGCAVICGDRFMIESPDATWDRYNKAVAAKAPMYALDTLLSEYNENKFNGNPLAFRKAELLRCVEPFVHEDVAVIWIDQTLPMITRLEKKYFDEWTNTISDYDIASVPDVGGADMLREKLRDYVTGKYVADKNMDAMLLTSNGTVLAVGDQVQVMSGKEQKPEHRGMQMEVTEVAPDGNITMKSGEHDGIFGYLQTDVYKTGKTKMLSA